MAWKWVEDQDSDDEVVIVRRPPKKKVIVLEEDDDDFADAACEVVEAGAGILCGLVELGAAIVGSAAKAALREPTIKIRRRPRSSFDSIWY